MSAFSDSCNSKFTAQQHAIFDIYEESIAQREWKRVHKGSAEVAKLDAFVDEAIQAVISGSTKMTAAQEKVWKDLISDGSGAFADAATSTLMSDDAPELPGTNNESCSFDWAQLACLFNSLAQAGTAENMKAALEVAKHYKYWVYICSDEVLKDPFYAKANQNTNTPAGGSTPKTPGGTTTPGGATPGGTLPGTTTGGAEPPKTTAKDNSKVWLGVGIGAAVLAAGAAAWVFWPKHGARQLAARNPARGTYEREMGQLLWNHGYDPKHAKRLEAEGMGPMELEGRLKHKPGTVGSLERTHGIQKRNDAWRGKAEKIIAELSRQSYEQANRLPSGQLRKKHVPYSTPTMAQDLVECLNTHDEERAKALFLSYDGLAVTRAYNARGAK